jgi:hypothetical protein
VTSSDDSTPPRRAASGECDLAGMLEALRALQPEDDETTGAIANLLGFSWLATAPSLPSVRPSRPPISSRTRLPKLPKPAAPRHASREPMLVEPRGRERAESTSFFDDADVMNAAPLEPTDPRTHDEPPEHVPLVAPRWFRGVFSELLATLELTGELDWRAVERAALTGEPLVTLPFGRERSLRRGAELWLDVSEAMQPFARDQAHLARALRRLLGRHAVRVRCFEVDGLAPYGEGLDWNGGGPNEIVPGACVLVVSDFGVGRAIARRPAATLAALTPWFGRARDRGCRLVGLIPAPVASWPAGLAQSLVGFEWDRALSAPAVRALTRASFGRS